MLGMLNRKSSDTQTLAEKTSVRFGPASLLAPIYDIVEWEFVEYGEIK